MAFKLTEKMKGFFPEQLEELLKHIAYVEAMVTEHFPYEGFNDDIKKAKEYASMLQTVVEKGAASESDLETLRDPKEALSAKGRISFNTEIEIGRKATDEEIATKLNEFRHDMRGKKGLAGISTVLDNIKFLFEQLDQTPGSPRSQNRPENPGGTRGI